GRETVQADGSHHQLDDAWRAAQSGHHQWLAQTPHRHGFRHPGAGYRASDQAAQADAEDDEEGRRQRRHDQDDARYERYVPRWWDAQVLTCAANRAVSGKGFLIRLLHLLVAAA